MCEIKVKRKECQMAEFLFRKKYGYNDKEILLKSSV